MIIAYNKTKNEKLVLGDSYSDAVLLPAGGGHQLRVALSNQWKGDGVVVADEAHLDASTAKEIKAGLGMAEILERDRDFLWTYGGAAYDVKQGENGKYVRRWDTLIMLLSIDMPEDLKEPYYKHLNGLWADRPINTYDEIPAGVYWKDITCDWDTESFYLAADDDTILAAVGDDDVSGDYWVGDILAALDDTE